MKLTAQNLSRWAFWLTLFLIFVRLAFAILAGTEPPLISKLDPILALGFWAPVLYNWLRRRGEAEDRALFLIELGDLIRLGIAETEALEQLAKIRARELGSRFGDFSYAVGEVSRRLHKGDDLTQAFEQTAGIPEHWGTYLRFCRDREGLVRMLDELGDAEKARLNLPILSCIRAQVMLVMLLGIVFFLADYILPTFQDLFLGMNLQLPLGTRIMLSLQDNSVTVICGALFGLLCWLLLLSIPFLWVRRKLWLLAFYTPGLSLLVKRTNQAKLLKVLAAAATAEVPAKDALLAASSAATVPAYRRCLREAADRPEIPLSETILRYPALFRPEVVWLIKQGEELENLPAALQAAGDLSVRDLQERSDKFATDLDTVLLVFIGLLAGFLVVNTTLPQVLLIEAMGP